MYGGMFGYEPEEAASVRQGRWCWARRNPGFSHPLACSTPVASANRLGLCNVCRLAIVGKVTLNVDRL